MATKARRLPFLYMGIKFDSQNFSLAAQDFSLFPQVSSLAHIKSVFRT